MIALSVLPVLADAQTIYRWVDEHGRTHYSEHAPGQGRAGIVDCPPPPSAQEVEEARKRGERSRSEAERLQRDRQSRDSRGRPGQSHECHRRRPSKIIVYPQGVTQGLFTAL